MGTEFQSELCKRLPFGEAVLRLSQFALSDENLQAIYDSCRGQVVREVDYISLVRQPDWQGVA